MLGKPKEYVIGRLYHCDWASNRGFVWRLIAFDADRDYAKLETPKTRKWLDTKLSSLRDTNKTILENISSKNLEV
jgi:hypothetical protein